MRINASFIYVINLKIIINKKIQHNTRALQTLLNLFNINIKTMTF